MEKIFEKSDEELRWINKDFHHKTKADPPLPTSSTFVLCYTLALYHPQA